MKTSYEVNTAERIQLALDNKLPKDQPITKYERECCLIIAKTTPLFGNNKSRNNTFRSQAKRVIAKIDSITSAGGLIEALKLLQARAESDPCVIGHGQMYAGISLQLTRDLEEGDYEIEFSQDP